MNENQKIVLHWLKENGKFLPMAMISEVVWECGQVAKSYIALSAKEQFEVIQAFAEWGLSKED